MPANRKPWRHWRDENNLLVAALLLALSSLLIVNGVYVVNHLSNTSAATPGTPATHQLTSQAVAQTPSLTARISKVTENSTPDPAFTLPDGQTMLIMNLSITNRTSAAQDFIPTNNLYVRTPTGDYSALHASMFVTKPLPSTKLAPGQTVSGQISFGVPAHASSLLLYIDTGWNSEVPVVYNVLQ